jgi:YidC/Oxa1 family membrane protein insertase
MGKKDQIIGILCILCALVLLFKLDIAKHGVKMVAKEPSAQRETPMAKRVVDPVRSFVQVRDDEKIFLENDFVKVEFTSSYGAIDRVFLKKYKKSQGGDETVIFNEDGCSPVLGLLTGSTGGDVARYVSGFSVKSFDGRSILFGKIDENGLEIIRSYSLPETDGKNVDAHVISHSTSIVNRSDSANRLKNIGLSLGSIPATDGDVTGDYLNFGYYNGKSAEFIKLRDFAASKGFFGLGSHDSRDFISEKKNIVWGSVKNQFFTAILTPSMRASGFLTQPVQLGHGNDGISAEMTFKVGDIAAHGEYSLPLDFYVGPKDFARLDRMQNRQDLVMQFGFFGIISKFLLFTMLGIHSLVSNWGLAIILLTMIVKLCLWPLTTAQVRTSKKMTAIQEPLKAIKEKYKNNPGKVQAETMKLFKHYRVNPAAGCLPIFIQIPIFFGLYFMLRTSSELRFAHFLWIKDLSLADTIAHIGSFPVNILPLVMCVTMALQMHMTPMPSTDGSQKMVFKLMPVIFLFCCYSFPSGLVLYWTVQNILTILQQCIVSRRRDMQVGEMLNADRPDEKLGKSRRKKNFTR